MKKIIVRFFVICVILGVSAYASRAEANDTFVYLLMDSEIPQAASPDGLDNTPSVEAFRYTSHGLTRVHDFQLSPNDVLRRLVATPDGRFLFEECASSSIDPSSPTYYIEYRILPSGRVRPLRRIGLPETGGGVSLSFGSSRTAYMVTPYDTKPARVLSFRFTSNGHFIPVGIASPCGETYSPLTMSQSGTSAYLPDRENRVWQYRVGPDGQLMAMTPPFLDCGFDPASITVLPNGRGVYVATMRNNDTPSQIYQFGSSAGSLHPLTPPFLMCGKDVASLAPSSDSRRLYVGGESFASFFVTASGALRPLSLKLSGRRISPITLDYRTGILYALDSDQHKLRAFTSASDGKLRAIKGIEIRQYGLATKIVVVHQ